MLYWWANPSVSGRRGAAEGVTKVLEILRHELELAMKLTGKATIAEVDMEAG